MLPQPGSRVPLRMRKWSSREAWHLAQGHSDSTASLPPFIPLLGSEIVLVEPAPFSHQPSCLLPRTVPLNLSLLNPGLSVGGQRAPWLEEPAQGTNGRTAASDLLFLIVKVRWPLWDIWTV